MDNFKKYLQQHNDAMDVDAPSPAAWNNIENSLSAKESGKFLKFTLQMAAAAAVVTAIVIAGIRLPGTKQDSPVSIAANTADIPSEKIIKDSAQPALAATTDHSNPVKNAATPVSRARKTKQVDERYKMMESFKENYGQLVNYQLKSIRSTPVYAEDPDYFEDFKTRLKQMDLDEITIRNSIRRQGMSNVLLEQLINVYQEKLDVLKILQAEINKMNERVKENLPADSLTRYYLNI